MMFKMRSQAICN